MRFLALCLVVILGWPVAVEAGCHVRYAAYQAPAYVAPAVAVVASYVPIAVAVPAYSVGYAAGAAVSTDAPAVASELPPVKSPCEEQLADLKARLATLEAKTGIQVTATAPAASVIVNRCAACHDEKVSKIKGKGVSLTALGKELPLTNEVRLKAIEKIVAGEMPKDGTLTDEETTLIITQLSKATAAEGLKVK